MRIKFIIPSENLSDEGKKRMVLDNDGDSTTPYSMEIQFEWNYGVLPNEGNFIDIDDLFDDIICDYIQPFLSWHIVSINWKKDKEGIYPQLWMVGE